MISVTCLQLLMHFSHALRLSWGGGMRESKKWCVFYKSSLIPVNFDYLG